MLQFPPELSLSGKYLSCVSSLTPWCFPFIVCDSKLLLQEGFGRDLSSCVTNLHCSCYHYKSSYSHSVSVHYYKNAYLLGFAVNSSDFRTAAADVVWLFYFFFLTISLFIIFHTFFFPQHSKLWLQSAARPNNRSYREAYISAPQWSKYTQVTEIIHNSSLFKFCTINHCRYKSAIGYVRGDARGKKSLQSVGDMSPGISVEKVCVCFTWACVCVQPYTRTV